MTLLLTGLNAIALMESEGNRSVVVVHVGEAAVKSVVCQMPPLTVAANTCLSFVGSTAKALTAPASCCVAGVVLMTLPALVIGAGPSGAQPGTPMRSTESSRRLSSDSNEKSCRFGRAPAPILFERRSRLEASMLKRDFARVVVRRPFIVASCRTLKPRHAPSLP